MHAERTRLRPYPLPDLALPAQSEWQSTLEARLTEPSNLRTALARLAQEQRRTIEYFESSISSPAAFASWMERFAGEAAGIATLADPENRIAEPSPITLIIDNADRRGASHAIYDQFFHVSRNPGLGLELFASTILSAYARVLLDLPYSTIARHETLYLLRAMTRSLAIIAGDRLEEESGLSVVPFKPANRTADLAKALDEAWAICDVDPEWLKHVADHRWLSGHHLFFLFANFCRVSLDRATQALAAQQYENVANHLIDAGLFQRTFASAMWYAGDFPPSLYRAHTRPWMSSAGAANGFSGSDNIDYADLHRSRETAVNALFSTFGSNAEAWPPQVEQALRGFHEMETQHAEHHVQVAARMIGSDTSLVQKRMTRTVYNAVDVLRDMVAEEWNELAQRFV